MYADKPHLPLATYRVQLHAGFTLDDAAAIVPYLADLGISHLYTSPVLQAAPGSTHGYDVVDHARVNEELGGVEAFDRLTDALRAHGLGLILDIVPNHMAISGEENRWWWDVLEHGPASRYASYFDVDWDPPESRLRNVILLPVLPDHYGRVLEAGAIRLARRGGQVVAEHEGRAYPLDPQTTDGLVADAAAHGRSDELGSLAAALAALPRSSAGDPELVLRRQRDAQRLAERLAKLVEAPALAGALDAAIVAINADVDTLDLLLERQNYRLALWRAASHDLGYRRFFDIDGLIGLRVEDERVYRDTHALVLRWVAEGRVHGLRVDHPDGLRDPAAYFERLRADAPEAWILAEKVLEPGEALPTDWAVDGTTGYRFANLATGLQVDPAGEPQLSAAWADVADIGPGWDEIASDARAEVLSSLLGSDVNRLTRLFLAICVANRRNRDFTRRELHHALREVAAALPVYRTYVRATDRHVADEDARVIGDAVALATERRPDLDPDLFSLLGRILRLEIDGPLASELALRFQQLTPAAMAKGIEDTAFYRHHRLVALNEVGGDPDQFGIAIEELHGAMDATQAQWPLAMLALSTHDTKRSADLRARLALIAEEPSSWRTAVGQLTAASASHRAGRDHPTSADGYLFFQVVVGAWPINATRAAAYLEKASREAKLRTSWRAPDPAYDEAITAFAHGCLNDPAFVAAVEATVAPLVEPGWRAALAQLALQLTAPGVPDLYQGSEVWDLSLVDPDNRRPVDYDLRRRLLVAAATIDAAEAWRRRDDGIAKLWLIRRALELRRRHAAAFGPAGKYRSMVVLGDRAEAAFAFGRGDEVVSLVPRLVRRVARLGWGDTTVRLPVGQWRGLDGREHIGAVLVNELLRSFPVAILERVA